MIDFFKDFFLNEEGAIAVRLSRLTRGFRVAASQSSSQNLLDQSSNSLLDESGNALLASG